MNRMVSCTLFCLVAFSGALYSTTAFAEDGGKPFIGIGVELDKVFTAATTGLGGSQVNHSLYVPINLTPSLRIEPILSIATSSRTQFDEDKDNNVETTTEQSDTVLGLGVGAFYMWSLTDSISAYGGGRLQFARVSSSNRVETNTPGNKNISGIDSSRNALGIGGALGTEWYFTKYLSIGGEAQLNFTYLGTPTTELEPNPGANADEDTDTSTAFGPNVEVFFRFYFM